MSVFAGFKWNELLTDAPRRIHGNIGRTQVDK